MWMLGPGAKSVVLFVDGEHDRHLEGPGKCQQAASRLSKLHRQPQQHGRVRRGLLEPNEGLRVRNTIEESLSNRAHPLVLLGLGEIHARRRFRGPTLDVATNAHRMTVLPSSAVSCSISEALDNMSSLMCVRMSRLQVSSERCSMMLA